MKNRHISQVFAFLLPISALFLLITLLLFLHQGSHIVHAVSSPESGVTLQEIVPPLSNVDKFTNPPVLFGSPVEGVQIEVDVNNGRTQPVLTPILQTDKDSPLAVVSRPDMLPALSLQHEKGDARVHTQRILAATIMVNTDVFNFDAPSNVTVANLLAGDDGADNKISLPEAIGAVNNDWATLMQSGHTIQFDSSLNNTAINFANSLILSAPNTTIDGDILGNSGPDLVLVPPSGFHSLVIQTDNAILRNIAISGLSIDGANASDNLLDNVFLGTNPSGEQAQIQNANGIEIENGANNNEIKNSIVAGNSNSGPSIKNFGIVIHNNAHSNIIQHNTIGLNKLQQPLANDVGLAIINSNNNLIGGIRPKNSSPNDIICISPCNVISSNKLDGIQIEGVLSTNNKISGNFIGTNVMGTAAQANIVAGIRIYDGANTNTIGGLGRSEKMCVEDCNLISGNTSYGIVIQGGGVNANVVKGNVIGLNSATTAVIPNKSGGLYIGDGAASNVIGQASTSDDCLNGCNLISGNLLTGLVIKGTGSVSNIVRGNFIGADAAGDPKVNYGHSGYGVAVIDASDNVIGGVGAREGNIIAGNKKGGILIHRLSPTGDATHYNEIRRNRFFFNQGPLIDLAPIWGMGVGSAGPNDNIGMPRLGPVKRMGSNKIIEGNVTAADGSLIEVYGDGGDTYLGQTTVTNNAFILTLPAATATSKPIVATATDPSGNSSEFSRPAKIGLSSPYALPNGSVFAWATVTETVSPNDYPIIDPEVVFNIVVDNQTYTLSNKTTDTYFIAPSTRNIWFKAPTTVGTYPITFIVNGETMAETTLEVITDPKLVILTDIYQLKNEFIATGSSNSHQDMYQALARLETYANAHRGVLLDLRQEVQLSHTPDTTPYDHYFYIAGGTTHRLKQAQSIDSYINSLITYKPSLQYLAIIGDDRVVPAFRRTDPLNMEKGYANSGRGPLGNPTIIDSGKGYIITDVPYASFDKTDPNSVKVPAPDLAVGRIFHANPIGLKRMIDDFEKPLQIRVGKPLGAVYQRNDSVNFLNSFRHIQSPIQISLRSQPRYKLTGQTIPNSPPANAFYVYGGHTSWRDTEVREILNKTMFSFILSHANAGLNSTNRSSSSFTINDLNAVTSQVGRFAVNLGCHAGYFNSRASSLGHDQFSSNLTNGFLNKHIAYLASTTYSYIGERFPKYNADFSRLFIYQMLGNPSLNTVGAAYKNTQINYNTRRNPRIGSLTWDKYDTYIRYGTGLYGLPTQCLGACKSSTPPAASLTSFSMRQSAERQSAERQSADVLLAPAPTMTHTITVQANDLQFDRIDLPDGTTRFTLPNNGGLSGVAHYPQLPQQLYEYHLPAGSQVQSIALKSSTATTLPSTIAPERVTPVNLTFGAIEESVTLTATYPSQIYWSSSAAVDAGVLLYVGILPMQYNPSTEQVTLFTDVELEINYRAPTHGVIVSDVEINSGNPISRNLVTLPLAATVNSTATQAVSLTWQVTNLAGDLVDVVQTSAQLNVGSNTVMANSDSIGWQVGQHLLSLSVGKDGVALASGSKAFVVNGRSLDAHLNQSLFNKEVTATLTINVFDQNGVGVNGLAAMITTTTDTTPMTLTLTQATTGTYQATVDLTSFSEGSHRLTVGGLSNVEVLDLGFTIDQTPPMVTVTVPTSHTASLILPITWSGEDDGAGLDHYELQFRGGAGNWTDWFSRTAALDYYAAETTAFFGPYAPISVTRFTTYSFRIRGVDLVGNRSVYTHGVSIATDLLDATGNPPMAMDRQTAVVGIISGTNAYRASLGLPPLKQNELIEQAAQEWGPETLADSNCVSHIGSDGSTEAYRMLRAGYLAIASAENLNAGIPDVATSMAAWINSPIHQPNLASSAVNELGVGYSFNHFDLGVTPSGGLTGVYCWVQKFGSRADTFPVIINDEAETTNSTSVDLYLYGAGWADEMQISNHPGFSGATWQPFVITPTWVLSSGTGVRTVYVQLRDTIGEIRQAHDDILLGVAPPRGVDVGVQKMGDPDLVMAGELLTYTLVITSAGPSPATGVYVVDVLPMGMELVNGFTTQGFCSEAAGTVSCEIGEMGALAQVTVTLTTIPKGAIGTLSNTAVVLLNEQDKAPNNNRATMPTTVLPASNATANLQIGKTDNVVSGVVNYPVQYTIIVTNQGDFAATNVTLTDTVVGNFGLGTVTPSQGSCGPTHPVVCTLGTLFADSTLSVTMVVTPTSASTLVNTAVVAAMESDPVPSNNRVVLNTAVVSTFLTDLALTLESTPSPMREDKTLIYTTTVVNNGPMPVTGLTVNQVLPTGFFPAFPGNVLIGGTPVSGNYSYRTFPSYAEIVATFATATLNPGETFTITYTFLNNVHPGLGTHSSFAYANGSIADPVPQNDADQVVTEIIGSVDLALSVDMTANPVIVGQPLTFTLTVVNQGPLLAANSIVTYTRPFEYSFLSASAGCVDTGSAVVCDLGSLAKGVSVTRTIVVSPFATGRIFNTFIVVADPNDTDLSDNSVAMLLLTVPSGGDTWSDQFGAPGVDGIGTDLAVMENGDVVVLGDFSFANQTFSPNLARWDGQTWQPLVFRVCDYYSFGFCGSDGNDLQAVTTAGGDIYVGGRFQYIENPTGESIPLNNVGVWDGTTWAAMGEGISATIRTMTSDASGAVYASIYNQIGITHTVLMWDGSDWLPLGGGPGFAPLDLFVDGAYLYAVGNGIAYWDGLTWTMMPAPGSQMGAIERYNGALVVTAEEITKTAVYQWSGVRWNQLGGDIYRFPDDIAVGLVEDLGVFDGELYVGGFFRRIGTIPVAHIAKWDGVQWREANSGIKRHYHGFYPRAHKFVGQGNQFYVASTYFALDKRGAWGVAQLKNDRWQAVVEEGEGHGITDKVGGLALTPDGGVVAGGRFNAAGHIAADGIALWNGHEWDSLGTGVTGTNYSYSNLSTHIGVAAVAALGNDVFAGGDFNYAGGNPVSNVARYNRCTGQWDGLKGGVTGGPTPQVLAMVTVADDLYIAGQFTHAGGVLVNNIARYHLPTGQWYAVGAGTNYTVRALAYDASTGDLYAGGDFSAIGELAVDHVARWDGNRWFALDLGVDGAVYALAAHNGTLTVGGSFLNASGTPANRIAQWDGNHWAAMGSGASVMVEALAVNPANGHVVTVRSENSSLYTGLYPLSEWDGSQWMVLDSGLRSNAPNFTDQDAAQALLMHKGDIFVGGYFWEAGLYASRNIARYHGGSGDGVDLAVTKCADPNPVLQAEALTYTLTIANVGTMTATDVVMVDVIPGGLSGATVSSTQMGCYGVATISCTLPMLLPNDTVTVTVVATPTVTGWLNNTAVVSSNEVDVYPDNNITSEQTHVGGSSEADVMIVNQIVSTPVLINGRITYTLWITNDGRNTATNVVVTDTLTGGGAFIWVAPSQGNCTGTPPIVCQLGSINRGGTAMITITAATPVTAATFSNMAVVATDAAESHLLNNRSRVYAFASPSSVGQWDDRFASPPANFNIDLDGLGYGVTGLAHDGEKVYIVGDFLASGSAQFITRWNGRTWETPGSTSRRVNAVAISGDDVYVGGAFGSFSDSAGTLVAASLVARYHEPSDSWHSLGQGVDNSLGTAQVWSVAVDGDDVFVGGTFIEVVNSNGVKVTSYYMAHWDGTQWHSLGTALPDTVHAILVDGNDVYAGGSFGLRRWNRLSQSWSGTLTGNMITALALRGTELYIGSLSGIEKLDTTTDIVTAVGGGVNGSVLSLAVDGDTVYAGGSFSQAGGQVAYKFARYDVNSDSWSPVPYFDSVTGGSGSVLGDGVAAITVRNGEVFIGGTFDQVELSYGMGIVARYDGNQWYPLGQGNNGTSRALTAFGDIYVSGNFDIFGRSEARGVARWDGSAWYELGDGLYNAFSRADGRAIAIDGFDLYVGGTFADAGGVAVNNIAHWDGSQWAGLNSGISSFSYNPVEVLAIDGDDLYVGGAFHTAGGISASNIARYDRVNGTWHSLASGTDGRVTAVVVDGDDVYVGGWFRAAGGVTVNGIARWNRVSQSWFALSNGLSDPYDGTPIVYALHVHQDKLYVGGNFVYAHNGGMAVTVENLAQWDINTQLWADLGNVVGGTVYTIDTLGNDLFVGGNFMDVYQAGGSKLIVKGLARWSGSRWWTLGNGASNVYDLLLQNQFLFVTNGNNAYDIHENGLGRYDLRLPLATDVAISKMDSPDPVQVNTSLTHTVVVTNNGSVRVDGVRVVDVLPSSYQFHQINGDVPMQCQFANGEVSCLLGRLEVNEVVTMTLHLTPTQTGLFTHTVTAFLPISDTMVVNNRATQQTLVNGIDLQVQKVASMVEVGIGERVTFTLTVTNGGNLTATAVQLVDTWQGAAVVGVPVPSQGSCSLGLTIRCNLGAIVPLEIVTMTVAMTPTAVGTLSNGVVVTATEDDTVPDNNHDMRLVQVGTTDVVVHKQAAALLMGIHELLTYTVTIVNNGPSLATHIVMSDTLPATVQLASVASSPPTTCEQIAMVVTCTLPVLDANTGVTITLAVTPTVDGVITNHVTVATGVPESDLNNNSDYVVTTITMPEADLVVHKTAAPLPIYDGQLMTYTIRVTNTGAGPAANVLVSDTLNALGAINFIQVTSDPIVPCFNYFPDIVCEFGTLQSGATVTASILVQVQFPGDLLNTAWATTSATDSDLLNNMSMITTTIWDQAGTADVMISKTAWPQTAVVGEALTYTILITNQGPHTATSVWVDDFLPPTVLVHQYDASQGLGCFDNFGTIGCDLGDVGMGDVATVTVAVTPTVSGVITNEVSAFPAVFDPVFDNNIARISTTVLACSAPPPIVPSLSIVRSGVDVSLDWTTHADNVLYDMWRGTTPYFMLGEGVWLGAVPAPTYVDGGVLSVGSMNYFYLTVGINSCHAFSDESNQVGVFNFSIEPGL